MQKELFFLKHTSLLSELEVQGYQPCTATQKSQTQQKWFASLTYPFPPPASCAWLKVVIIQVSSVNAIISCGFVMCQRSRNIKSDLILSKTEQHLLNKCHRWQQLGFMMLSAIMYHILLTLTLSKPNCKIRPLNSHTHRNMYMYIEHVYAYEYSNGNF